MTTVEVQALGEEPIDWRFKAFPQTDALVRVRDVSAQGWNVLAGDLHLPALVLKDSAVTHNLRIMADYCARHGVDLAPHAKTSMAPQLLERHLSAGAWGFTVATTSQARTLRRFGFPRLLLASQMVEPAAIQWASAEMDTNDEFQLISIVDSVDGVDIMTSALAARSARRPLPVLVELGQVGGRTGCRTLDQVVAVVDAIDASPYLQLVGVEGFEGLIDAGSPQATLAAVDKFLGELRDVTLHLAKENVFDHLDTVIVTAGGSAYFDLVVDHLTDFDIGRPVQTILRSGGYVTHDSRMYEVVSPLAERGDVADEQRLRPAFEVWAAVWSRPEPELAIVGMGKRDAPFDYGLPMPRMVRDRTGVMRSAAAHELTALNDQHGYVRVPASDPIAPGDVIGFGISHPCTAFDKWRLIPVVDDSYTVVDAMFTFF